MPEATIETVVYNYMMMRMMRASQIIVGRYAVLILWQIGLFVRWVVRQFYKNADCVRILVIPPTSPGSLGDEAMAVVTINELRRNPSNEVHIAARQYPDKWDHLPQVKVFWGLARLRERISFLNLIKSTLGFCSFHTILILGADMIDGVYGESGTTYLLWLAKFCAIIGIKTSIVSFSFSTMHGSRLHRAWTNPPEQLYLSARDEISRERLRSYVGVHAQLSADVAFLLDPDYESVQVKQVKCWAHNQHELKRAIIGLCPNLIHATSMTESGIKDLAYSYVNFINEMYAVSQCSVSYLLASHDHRTPDLIHSDDLLIKDIVSMLPDHIRNECYLVPGQVNAREIKAMCSYIDIALSGKMHFAIACLGQCVPTVCISYNGKFEGLYMHFGLKELIIEPSLLSDYKRVTELFNSALLCREDLRKQIASQISAVRKLSYVNFANI